MNTMLSRFAAWSRKNMPKREQMERSRFIPNRVLKSELWRFTRRSVPRGVALGMLVGIIVPFAQIIFAALLSMSVRANVPVAALTTFVTNPFTTPFIWLLAYKVGSWMLQVDAMTIIQPVTRTMQQTEFDHLLQWLTGATLVTAFGLLVIAIVAAAVSYLVTSFTWTRWIAHKRKQRLERARALRAEQ
jgi:uncharacterized protein (DUF2062 family)